MAPTSFRHRALGPVWLTLAAVAVGLFLVACDGDEDDGADGTATMPGTATATEDGETATSTPDGTSDGTAAPAEDGDQQYSAALQLALEQEIGSEDVGNLVQEWDIDVLPNGEGLPEGSGTVEEGSQIYQAQCAACHGQELQGGIGPRLVAEEPGTVWKPGDTPAIGNWWPYATIVWDYTNRAMPFFEPGTLSADEVYALTAFMLAENGIIEADQELNQDNLADVEMPARDIYHACWPDSCYEEYGRDGGD